MPSSPFNDTMACVCWRDLQRLPAVMIPNLGCELQGPCEPQVHRRVCMSLVERVGCPAEGKMNPVEEKV